MTLMPNLISIWLGLLSRDAQGPGDQRPAFFRTIVSQGTCFFIIIIRGQGLLAWIYEIYFRVSLSQLEMPNIVVVNVYKTYLHKKHT